ncbi:LOW QUALITY PROTEIN: xyloside xylosyltransferase 1 [Nilaparvata lugens]|uniref:LOW QUALITY PROTEIN: xyloside xylosyltransferase 1 n=1 Tax=Nilaparvata lugens TaxID=108931 RepID=UPI00193E8C75|nr:LOW QUALITY PROTEIN: xyloside xylosyltransferase 1 [Nilaparvata lugens]
MKFYKVVLNLALLLCVIFIVVLYVYQTEDESHTVFHRSNGVFNGKQELQEVFKATVKSVTSDQNNTEPIEYNVWCIFTKVKNMNSPLKFKFENMLSSILQYSSIVIILNIISDARSKYIVESVINKKINETGKQLIKVKYHSVETITSALSNVTVTMQPFFSPHPGAYYSDALFFISLGLYRLASPEHRFAVMLDIDIELQTDIANLFNEFQNFSPDNLIGLAPELSPVYQHILYAYRSRHKTSLLGSPLSAGGFPGLNSGVILFPLDRIRASPLYQTLLTLPAIQNLTSKYSFKGHLGDQDWYTLVAMEHPHLIHQLDCAWNRQLCLWWRDHGYHDTFHQFARCPRPAHILHGNCNTPIPRSPQPNLTNHL